MLPKVISAFHGVNKCQHSNALQALFHFKNSFLLFPTFWLPWFSLHFHRYENQLRYIWLCILRCLNITFSTHLDTRSFDVFSCIIYVCKTHSLHFAFLLLNLGLSVYKTALKYGHCLFFCLLTVFMQLSTVCYLQCAI